MNVKVVVPPGLIFAAPNALLIDGGAKTVIDARAITPIPPSVEFTGPVALFITPAVVAVTSTVTRQAPPEDSIPPLNVNDVAPALGVNVPPQVSLAFGVAATCNPAGKKSVNEMPESGLEFGLFRVNLRVTTPLSGIVLSVTVAVPPPDAPSPLLPAV